MSYVEDSYVAPCGMYCGMCAEKVISKKCHGCGCNCGKCDVAYRHRACHIYQCVTEKGIGTCAECDELPCAYLVEFTFDSVQRTHLNALNNLRRIRKIGKEKWLDEQRAHLSSRRRLERTLELTRECLDRQKNSMTNRGKRWP